LRGSVIVYNVRAWRPSNVPYSSVGTDADQRYEAENTFYSWALSLVGYVAE